MYIEHSFTVDRFVITGNTLEALEAAEELFKLKE